MENISEALKQKYDGLLQYLKEQKSIAIAFSGGVDSTFLLYAAHEALEENCVAVTEDSAFFPGREYDEAVEFCKGLGVRHIILSADILGNEIVAANPADRCYHCKKNLFTQIKELAVKEGIAAVAEGSNLDDNGDYRPGLKAIAELGVLSPLRSAGFSKSEIRELSKTFLLPTWDKPSFACLASRIPYGERLTEEKLSMVDRAEQILICEGFKQFRVRLHEGAGSESNADAKNTGESKKTSGVLIARIELLPGDFGKIIDEETRTRVYEEFKKTGFDYVALDLKGYRTGSLNETLGRQQ
ncbi:MAG: ATP-dependent sacrificial sulfur transferase LarE [Lachnospiraceae bacterium]|nr:ATP-dependent sacrificial sulfur transferase LarE [Lachnospiraceae bacterium]